MEKTLTKEILYYIAEHEGCRQRSIASALHLWLCDNAFLDDLWYLHYLGLVRNETVRDPAQMENYFTWYLTEKGKYAIMCIETEKENDEND
jgi:hypothetical protein